MDPDDGHPSGGRVSNETNSEDALAQVTPRVPTAHERVQQGHSPDEPAATLAVTNTGTCLSPLVTAHPPFDPWMLDRCLIDDSRRIVALIPRDVSRLLDSPLTGHTVETFVHCVKFMYAKNQGEVEAVVCKENSVERDLIDCEKRLVSSVTQRVLVVGVDQIGEIVLSETPDALRFYPISGGSLSTGPSRRPSMFQAAHETRAFSSDCTEAQALASINKFAQLFTGSPFLPLPRDLVSSKKELVLFIRALMSFAVRVEQQRFPDLSDRLADALKVRGWGRIPSERQLLPKLPWSSADHLDRILFEGAESEWGLPSTCLLREESPNNQATAASLGSSGDFAEESYYQDQVPTALALPKARAARSATPTLERTEVRPTLEGQDGRVTASLEIVSQANALLDRCKEYVMTRVLGLSPAVVEMVFLRYERVFGVQGNVCDVALAGEEFFLKMCDEIDMNAIRLLLAFNEFVLQEASDRPLARGFKILAGYDLHAVKRYLPHEDEFGFSHVWRNILGYSLDDVSFDERKCQSFIVLKKVLAGEDVQPKTSVENALKLLAEDERSSVRAFVIKCEELSKQSGTPWPSPRQFLRMRLKDSTGAIVLLECTAGADDIDCLEGAVVDQVELGDADSVSKKVPVSATAGMATDNRRPDGNESPSQTFGTGDTVISTSDLRAAAGIGAQAEPQLRAGQNDGSLSGSASSSTHSKHKGDFPHRNSPATQGVEGRGTARSSVTVNGSTSLVGSTIFAASRPFPSGPDGTFTFDKSPGKRTNVNDISNERGDDHRAGGEDGSGKDSNVHEENEDYDSDEKSASNAQRLLDDNDSETDSVISVGRDGSFVLPKARGWSLRERTLLASEHAEHQFDGPWWHYLFLDLPGRTTNAVQKKIRRTWKGAIVAKMSACDSSIIELTEGEKGKMLALMVLFRLGRLRLPPELRVFRDICSFELRRKFDAAIVSGIKTIEAAVRKQKLKKAEENGEEFHAPVRIVEFKQFRFRHRSNLSQQK